MHSVRSTFGGEHLAGHLKRIGTGCVFCCMQWTLDQIAFIFLIAGLFLIQYAMHWCELCIPLSLIFSYVFIILFTFAKWLSVR